MGGRVWWGMSGAEQEVGGGTEGFVTINIIADHFGKSVRTIRYWMGRRLIPCYKPTDRTLLFKISECDAAMMKFRAGGVE